MNDRNLDTAEAARRAGVSGDTIRRWIRIGLLRTYRVGPGRRYRVYADELASVVAGSASPVTSLADPGVPAGKDEIK